MTISREQFGVILLNPNIAWPESPDFWAYQNRPYRERKYVEMCRSKPQKEILKEYRQRLRDHLNDLLDNMTARDKVLISSFVGGGKTTTTAEVLNAKEYRQVWFVETHEQANEISELFKGKNPVILRSRTKMVELGELDCDYAKHFANGNPLATMAICDNAAVCGKLKTCEYHARRRAAARQDTKILIVTHTHLVSSALLRDIENKGKYDIVVIDENFLLSSATEKVIPKSAIIKYRVMIQSTMTNVQSQAETRFCNMITTACKELLEANKTDDYFIIRQHATQGVPKEIQSLLMSQAKQHFTNQGRLQPDLTAEIMQAVTTRTNFWWEGDNLKYIQPSNLPKSIPCLFLDAEGDPIQYSIVLNTPVQEKSLEAIFHVPQTAKIIQFDRGAYGKSTFFKFDGPDSKAKQSKNTIPSMHQAGIRTFKRTLRLLEVICKKHKDDDLRIALITHQPLEAYFRCFIRKQFPQFKLISDYDKAHGDRDDTEHFYNLRGTNAYAKHTVLVVIGTPFISRDAMVSYVRRIYNLYSKDKLKLLRESLDEYTETQGWEKIRFSSGEARTIKAISYNNTRLQSIYDIRVLKELYQAVGRIRPYRPLKTNEQVTVYLVTDVPMRWYEIEKLRPSLNNFIRTKPASCHPSHREKLRKIAKVVKTVPPKFMSKDFYSAYELQFGPQSRKQRNVLRKLLNQHAESLGIAPPEGQKQTFVKVGNIHQSIRSP